MTGLHLLLAFLAACGAGIIAAVFWPRRAAPILGWAGGIAAGLLAGAGAAGLIGPPASFPLWLLPSLGLRLSLQLDPLSGAFLVAGGLVLLPASVFAAGQLGAAPATRPARALAVMLLGLYASIGVILAAGDAVLFLLAWEIMSVLSYLLIALPVTAEDGPESPAYLLLALGEAGTLAAAMAFLILGHRHGGLAFPDLRSAAGGLGPAARWAVFLLSFFGFGVKAGLVPVNFWLPRAYAAAPRMFAPVLAGATLNLGLYGLWRVNADLCPASFSGPGMVALVVGAGSALIGILYATTENDLKAMLAHSSIENAGIVVTGFGAGMVFLATRHPALASIAFVAALYHAINHALYKTLLFVGAGTIESQCGERNMDRLGGLIRSMPLVAIGFLIGCLSIAALPPFNGFVSEWLTLQSLLRSAELTATGAQLVFALCGAALALTAALAVTCFVKAFAMTFLGMRRLDPNRSVSEGPRSALGAMAFLAVACVAFGILPTYIIPRLGRAAGPGGAARVLVPPFFAGAAAQGELPAAFVADFRSLGAQVGAGVLPGRGLVVLHRGGADNPVVFAMSTAYMLPVLLLLLALAGLVFKLGAGRKRQVVRRTRWDGGIQRLTPEMTYTATGFSNPVRVIFAAIFRPRTVEDTQETVAEHFRAAIRRERQNRNPSDRWVMAPIQAGALWIAARLAAMHHGRINAYVSYALIALLIVWGLLVLIPVSG